MAGTNYTILAGRIASLIPKGVRFVLLLPGEDKNPGHCVSSLEEDETIKLLREQADRVEELKTK